MKGITKEFWLSAIDRLNKDKNCKVSIGAYHIEVYHSEKTSKDLLKSLRELYGDEVEIMIPKHSKHSVIVMQPKGWA